MPAALLPRVRMMTVCDGVRESKTEAGVYNLKGVRQSIVVPTLPFGPRRLRLFLLLSSPRTGAFPCYVRVIQDRTNKELCEQHLR